MDYVDKPAPIVFGEPDIRGEEIAEVVDSLRSGWIGTGPKVARFEKDFATYKGIAANQVAAVNSCTAALHVSMIAAGIGAGDEVVTSAMTFCATINAIAHTGATPVLVDIDDVTLNMDIEQLEASITDRTKAILAVHFAGRPCHMDSIMSIAERNDLVVIEDCAHAIETEWSGRKAGTFGAFGCFSFYATKNVVTGEGGMVTANCSESIDRIRTLALHGMSKDAWHRFGDDGYKHYAVLEAGYKYNMTDIQASLGIHQLARIESNWHRRRDIWASYQKGFQGQPIGTPAEPAANTRHAYHLYTVTIDSSICRVNRDAFIAALHRRGIGVGVHYLSIAEHPYYQDRFGWIPDDWPSARQFGDQTVSLPLSPKLTDEQVSRVIAGVCDVLS